MALDSRVDIDGGESARDFRTTHWSMVLSAAQGDTAERERALERLCSRYWYPVYSFIRRRGSDPHHAQDLTQGFFARFLEKNYVSQADAAKGHFRTFLLSCVQSFLLNEWDRQNAQKRGGGVQFVSLDAQSAEERFRHEPIVATTPEIAFEKQWVEAVLESVLHRLKTEFEAAGKGEQFDGLKIYLIEDKGAVSFAEMARRFNTSEAAVKGIVRRMRQRYRDLFRDEIAQTVLDPREIDLEIQHLVSILST